MKFYPANARRYFEFSRLIFSLCASFVNLHCCWNCAPPNKSNLRVLLNSWKHHAYKFTFIRAVGLSKRSLWLLKYLASRRNGWTAGHVTYHSASSTNGWRASEKMGKYEHERKTKKLVRTLYRKKLYLYFQNF